MANFLSVNNIIFVILGYPMSFIEFFGTILYLWSVWLIAKRNIWTWPIGIVSVFLYMFLFYQIRLYSDTAEQIYYLGASVYGWWIWNKSSKEENGKIIGMQYSYLRNLILWIVCTGAISVAVGFLMTQIHTWLPVIFPEKASFPYIDALTTIMSFSAMWLMAQKKVESWIYWIIVDLIGIWLYFVKDVKFISLLYIVLLVIAINGFSIWHKSIQNNKSNLF